MKKMICLLFVLLSVSSLVHAETLAEKAKKFKQREAIKTAQVNVTEMLLALNKTVMAKIASQLEINEKLNQALVRLQGNVSDHEEAIEILIAGN